MHLELPEDRLYDNSQASEEIPPRLQNEKPKPPSREEIFLQGCSMVADAIRYLADTLKETGTHQPDMTAGTDDCGGEDVSNELYYAVKEQLEYVINKHMHLASIEDVLFLLDYRSERSGVTVSVVNPEGTYTPIVASPYITALTEKVTKFLVRINSVRYDAYRQCADTVWEEIDSLTETLCNKLADVVACQLTDFNVDHIPFLVHYITEDGAIAISTLHHDEDTVIAKNHDIKELAECVAVFIKRSQLNLVSSIRVEDDEPETLASDDTADTQHEIAEETDRLYDTVLKNLERAISGNLRLLRLGSTKFILDYTTYHSGSISCPLVSVSTMGEDRMKQEIAADTDTEKLALKTATFLAGKNVAARTAVNTPDESKDSDEDSAVRAIVNDIFGGICDKLDDAIGQRDEYCHLENLVFKIEQVGDVITIRDVTCGDAAEELVTGKYIEDMAEAVATHIAKQKLAAEQHNG